MSSHLKSYIAILSVCIFWGFSFISTKICLEWFTPFSLAFFRFLIATIILFIAQKIKKQDLKVDKEDIKKLILCGFTGVFLYFAFENLAIEMLSASLTAVLLALLPAFTIIADFIVLKAQFTKKKVISVTMSVIGAILVAGFDISSTPNMFYGIILIFLSILSWIVFCYLSAPLQKKYPTLKTTFYQSLFGMLFFLLALPFNIPNLQGITYTAIFNVVFLGAVCSALCYLLYNYAIKNISIVICSVFINIMPLVTIVASFFILSETITGIQIIGAILIIGSVFVITN